MVFNFFKSRKNQPVEEVKPVLAEPALTESAPLAPTPDEPAIQPVPALAQPDSTPEPEPLDSPAAVPAISEAEISVNDQPTPTEAPHSEEPPQLQGQLNTLKATREDVIAAYKIFLGRQPESMEVIDPRVGVTPMVLLVDFLTSKEFLDQPTKSQLVLAVAKKIVDARMAQDSKQSVEAEPVKPA